jgi:hypothetical protein
VQDPPNIQIDFHDVSKKAERVARGFFKHIFKIFEVVS